MTLPADDPGASFPETASRPLAPGAPVPDSEPTSTVDRLERAGRRLRCPHCHSPIDLNDNSPKDEVLCPACGGSFRMCETRQTTTTAPMRPLGRFQLLERVGVGAFGAVWKARDTELDRLVALKIPHAGLLSLEAERERFQREARAAAQLRHPGIVTVHEVALLDDLPTIVADFIEGVPLKDLLEVRPLTFREAAALIAYVAEALDYATVCQKAMAKAPAHRYPTARALADDLRRYLRGEPILARPVGAWERGWRWVWRHPTAAGLLLASAVALLALVTAGAMALALRKTEKARQEAVNARADADAQRLQAEKARNDADFQLSTRQRWRR